MNSDNLVPFRIARAAPGDEGIIVTLLRELAQFEKAPSFTLTESAIRRDLFGAAPLAFCDLAFVEDQPAGLALWFSTYRSFGAERGLFLEDLYVRPAFRGAGLGKALLKQLARQGGQLEWRVLDWNEKAIGFYRGLGAFPLKDWIVYRLEGEARERLGS